MNFEWINLDFYCESLILLLQQYNIIAIKLLQKKFYRWYLKKDSSSFLFCMEMSFSSDVWCFTFLDSGVWIHKSLFGPSCSPPANWKKNMIFNCSNTTLATVDDVAWLKVSLDEMGELFTVQIRGYFLWKYIQALFHDDITHLPRVDSNLRKDMPTQRRQHKKKWKIIIWAFNGHKRKDMAGRYQDSFKGFKL